MASETAVESEAKWGSHIDVEGKAGNHRNIGEADLFMPLSQDADTLVFADLRGRFDNQSSNEGNFGVGIRRMMNNGWNLGTYGYWDRRHSGTGNLFNQWTLGAEALGRDWDFRANAYIPQGDRIRDIGTTSEASISGASVQVTTSSQEERALGGFDAEAGWRVPLFEAEDYNQLRLYAGGYRFADSVLKISGPRVRAELVMAQLPSLWQDAQLLLNAEEQYDDARGNQRYLGIRLRIPFGASHTKTQQLSTQERRMTAPIVRDIDIVTKNRTSTLVEAATTTGGQAITVLDSATTTGATLPAAVTAAGANSTVILSGTFNTTATTVMQSGQTILGSGSLAVTSASGHAATLTLPGATIAASGGFPIALGMANNATLSGMTITNPYSAGTAYGVSAQSMTGVTISNNTITVGGANGGLAIDLNAASNATVNGNTITATSSGAGSAIGISAMGAVNSTIANNTFSLTGTTRYVIAGDNTASFAAGSTGNTTNGGVCFFVFGPPTGSVGFSTISCP